MTQGAPVRLSVAEDRGWIDSEQQSGQQFDKAVAVAEKAAEVGSFDTEVIGVLAHAHRLKGDSEREREVLQRGLRAHPRATQLWHGLATNSERRGDMQSALREARRAVEVAPRVRDYWAEYDRLARATGTPEAAVRFAQEVAESRPRDLASWLNYGDLLGAHGDLVGSCRAYRACLDIRSDNVAALDCLAINLADMGQFQEARKVAQTRVSASETTVLLRRLAWIDGTEKGPAQGIATLKTHLSKYPDDVAGWRLLSDWGSHTEDPGITVQAAEQLVRLAPLDFTARGHLARAYEAQGSFEHAGQLYIEALEQDPTYLFAARGVVGLVLDGNAPPNSVLRVQELSRMHVGPVERALWKLIGMIDVASTETKREILKEGLCEPSDEPDVFSRELIHRAFPDVNIRAEELERALEWSGVRPQVAIEWVTAGFEGAHSPAASRIAHLSDAHPHLEEALVTTYLRLFDASDNSAVELSKPLNRRAVKYDEAWGFAGWVIAETEGHRPFLEWSSDVLRRDPNPWIYMNISDSLLALRAQDPAESLVESVAHQAIRWRSHHVV